MYPPEVREKAVKMVKEGRTFRDVAMELGVSATAVHRWCSKRGVMSKRAHTANVFVMDAEGNVGSLPLGLWELAKERADRLLGKLLNRLIREERRRKEGRKRKRWGRIATAFIILGYLEKHGAGTNVDIQAGTGLSVRQVADSLLKLEKAGKVSKFSVKCSGSAKLRQAKLFGFRMGTKYIYYKEREDLLRFIASRLRFVPPKDAFKNRFRGRLTSEEVDRIIEMVA